MEKNTKILHDESIDLMRKVADGDVRAFECLYDKFCPILRHFFAKWCVDYSSQEDFIQRVFTRLWEQRRNFRGQSSVLTYLLSIARYTLKEEIRRSRMTTKMDLGRNPGFARESYNGLSQPETDFYLKELNAALERAKTMLTVEQQQALKISQAANSCYRKVLGCSQEAHKSRLKRARKHLWKLIAPVLKKGR